MFLFLSKFEIIRVVVLVPNAKMHKKQFSVNKSSLLFSLDLLSIKKLIN